MAKIKENKKSTESNFRPPVVAVLGHVDHGKTTLLDTIRKIDTASREFGGITQHVGAYQVDVDTKEGKKLVTFIDTPGHETFSKIRSQGVETADIAILVIAVNDGIKPQTRESIEHIKKAKIPVIVAFTKADLLEGHNLNALKGKLAKEGIVVEDQGGDVVSLLVSAKTGQGIKELLELIVLLAQMNNISGSKDAKLKAVVIESKVDRLRGVEANIIVKDGSLKVAEKIFTVGQEAKVRALINDKGESVSELLPGSPGKILGFSTPPVVGEEIKEDPFTLKTETKTEVEAEEAVVEKTTEEGKVFNIILKADSNNSLEALSASLPTSGLRIMSKGLGDISESDVWFAKSTKSFVVGFNVKVHPPAAKLAQFEKVRVKTYRIIYELLEEIREVIVGINRIEEEEVLGSATILAEFPFNNRRVAGVKVTEGRVARGDRVAIRREEEEVGRATVKSIRRFKEELNRIEVGQDGGVFLEPNIDFKLNDVLVSVQS